MRRSGKNNKSWGGLLIFRVGLLLILFIRMNTYLVVYESEGELDCGLTVALSPEKAKQNIADKEETDYGVALRIELMEARLIETIEVKGKEYAVELKEVIYGGNNKET